MSFLLALQFLTIIPVRLDKEVTPQLMGRSMVWFPLIGFLLGGLLAAADWLLRLVFPPTVSTALLLLVWVALTGALHLDGFLDCCDGLLAAKPPAKRLEILRDARVGAFAVVGAICLLLIKFAALLELPASTRPLVLLLVPALARAVMVFAARAYPYARPGPGLGQLFREGLGWRQVMAAGFIAVVPAGLILGFTGLGLSLVVWLMAVLIARWVQRRIPGLTGDVYGMINEVTEVGAILFLLALETVQ